MPPFIGELRAVAFTFAPPGWALCEGQTLPISENEALFTLIGTTFGGDGEETFRLPDLRGRVPIHAGLGRTHGQSGGAERITLNVTQIPSHTHAMQGSTAQAATTNVAGNVPATLLAAGTASAYGSDAPFRPLSPTALRQAGANASHENRQPFLCVNFMISLFGIFPQLT